MARPSKHPMPFELPAAATPAVTGAPTNELPLTADDVEFIQSLDPSAAGDERVRGDMLALLTEGETAEALAKYAHALAPLGVHAGPALAVIPQVRRLQRARRRLALAQALVTRNLQAVGAPVQGLASELNRVLASTPEHAPLRVAFSLFLAQWQATFRAPARPAKAAKPGDADDKDPT